MVMPRTEAAFPGTEVDFEVEKEVWNTYELHDKTILKMRTILTKLLRDPYAKPPPGAVEGRGLGFGSSFQNIVVVHKSAPELMGTPTHPPVSLGETETIEVDFTPFSEDWNIYRILGDDVPRGMKLKVKLVVSSVVRYKGVFDQFGYPIYFVNSTNAVVPVIPKQRAIK